MRYDPLIRGTGKVVAESLGKAATAPILEQAQHRLEALLRENANEPKALQKHTRQRIYPGIAMYSALRDAGVPQDKAVWYVREYYQRMCGVAAKFLRGGLKLPGLVQRVPKWMVSLSVKGFSEESGFRYEWPTLGENVAGFDIVQCPYLSTCTRYGCPELTVAFCDSDDATYGDMHPRLLWGRTSTLGHGAPCCDFRLTLLPKK